MQLSTLHPTFTILSSTSSPSPLCLPLIDRSYLSGRILIYKWRREVAMSAQSQDHNDHHDSLAERRSRGLLARRMNARVFGGGVDDGRETLVLAHGYGGSRFVWDDVVPSLAEKFRVVVFDWSFSGAAGCGGGGCSESGQRCSYDGFADELAALMDGLGLRGAVFVGHSMAGMIGCITSVARPDLFSHLVLVGASPRYINDDGYEGGFNRGEVDAMLAAIEADFAAWAPLFAEAVVGADHPAAVAKFAKQLASMRPGAALRVMRAVLTCDVRGVLPDVVARCTVLHCARDVVAPLSVARYMQRAMAGSAGGRGVATVVIESSGHFPQLTVPKEFVRVLESILLSTTEL